ncbi:MAG: DUF445 family protein [Planctomycetota bacterium]
MNKNSGTNLISLAIFLVSLLLPEGTLRFFLMQTGIFAFSGAITNWLAIYMLFEKIPFLYGSGVITEHFQEFKQAIRNLVMNTFFNPENINRYLKEEEHFHIKELPLSTLVQQIDFDSLFNGLVKLVLQSKLGGMLEMFGGAKTIEPLREGFKKIALEKINEVIENPEVLDRLNQKLKEKISPNAAAEILIPQITRLVETRLEELTPQMVKKIVEEVIRKHLGWLVIWGGVFGGLLGILTAALQYFHLI